MILRNGSGDVRTVVVGLVADPGLCTTIAGRLADELPEVLSWRLNGRVSWEIRVVSEAVPLDANGDVPLIEYARGKIPEQGWDLMVCLTDLPRREGTRPIIAEASAAYGAAQISLPALGWLRLRQNVRDTLVHLIGEMTGEASRPDRVVGDARRPFPRRPTELVSPVRRMPSIQRGIDVYLGLVGARGKLRLLLGMVRTNRPWRLVPGLSRATATAAAGGAFGIFFTNVWSLADAMSFQRLALINVFVVAAMVIWLIVYNSLWERPAGQLARKLATVYNSATVLTLAVGVVCMYVVLFGIILLGAVAVISDGYLQAVLGHPVGLVDYASLVWLSSSMGTLAGALGSGLENEDAVRRAAYSRREQQRHAIRRDQEKQEAETDSSAPPEER